MKNHKKLLNVLGVLAIAASIIMLAVGLDSTHLSELTAFFWLPIIPAIACFVAAAKKE